MSYRSIKRVLGETSLERKCRLLFGVSLLLLITGSFWWVERVTEDLVRENTIKTGRDYVESALLKVHFDWWYKSFPTEGEFNREQYKAMVEEVSKDLQSLRYDWKVVSLDPEDSDSSTESRIVPPVDQWERTVLPAIKKEWRQHNLTWEQGPSETAPGDERSMTENQSGSEYAELYSRLRPLPDRNEFYFYQPVQFTQVCRGCHLPKGMDGVELADAAAWAEPGPPFFVVKVVIPDTEAQTAISKNRAILLATAIITVFLSMVALYMIVRYVIVKPLTHLRDVSDEVSRGNTDLRANIQTNDEFEQLGVSFNRMLGHLIDAHQELRELNTDLDGRVDQLAQANMQLFEMNRLRSDFLANMSHELRTPLNSIIGFADVLQGIGALDAKQKRYAQNIQKSGRVLLDMINDILDLAKMESGNMEVRPVEFSIGSLLVTQCDMVQSLAEEKNIDLEVNVQAQLPTLSQDQGKVQQILTNLLSNAIKFTPEGGRIVVSARRKDQDQLEMTVADTGVGIAEEDRETIFEKFRQGNSAQGSDQLTREYTGTGLGLSIVRELCKLLGGSVSLESELGKGSTFTVQLPWNATTKPRPRQSLVRKLGDLTRPAGRELRSPNVALSTPVSTDVSEPEQNV